MIPWQTIGETTLPGGETMSLHRRDSEFSLRVANLELMNSRQHGSEEALAELALAELGGRADHVLVGGLGMGFTLRAALDGLGPRARVTVAELIPQVVEWNRGPLAHLAGEPLSDRRTHLVVADVADLIARGNDLYDAILLDTDNGPEGTTHDENERLYTDAGLRAAHSALKAGGVLAVWSAYRSASFTRRLARAGFEASERNVRSRGKKGVRHVVWLARKR